MKIILFSLFLIYTLYAKETLTICGTGDSINILTTIKKSFEEKQSDIKIVIPESIGSGGGIRNTAEGLCDIGRVARPIKEKEEKYNLKYIKFADSPIAIVTNKNLNSLKNISEKDLLAIYNGDISSWDQVDKSLHGKVYVIRREPGDSSASILNKQIAKFKDTNQNIGKVIFNTQDTTKIIQKHHNTIGYLPYSEAKQEGINILSLNNVHPLDSEYKLLVPLGLVITQNPQKSIAINSFIQYILSDEVKTILEKNGLVSIKY